MIPEDTAQSLSVKRAQVEFHNFASLGEPEIAAGNYRHENVERASVLRQYADFIGPMSPFLEIGANAGHTSYMLANEFGCEGFALDLSADALRHGRALQELWRWPRAPVRVAGDALHLPFADGSLRAVLACQMLSQFMDIEKVFLEVKRVLAPGGIFLFFQEPIRRKLSLRLYRCPYERQMKPWERKLNQWGMLGYLVKDVIGAHQEESFGIRQNHRMTLNSWDELIRRHFVAREFKITTADRGWAEHIVRRAARSVDRMKSEWLPAKLLGGELAAMCRKEGTAPESFPPMDRFEAYFRCPDCHGSLARLSGDELQCKACGYQASSEGGVYNLLASADRSELYPAARPDTVDFSQPEHAAHLLDGWYHLEGVYGAKFRWMGPRATAWLRRVRSGPQRIRARGFVHEESLRLARAVDVELLVNGEQAGRWAINRPGMFVVEADIPEADEYRLDIRVAPTFQIPPDARDIGVNFSMLRLIPREL